MAAVSRDGVADAVHMATANLRDALDAHGREIAPISDSMRGLHRLLSEALGDGGADEKTPASVPAGFQAWLEGAIERAGEQVKRVAIVRSSWQRLVDVGPRFASLEAMCELVAFDGKLVPADAPPQLARVELLDSNSPIGAATFPQPLFLVCQVLASGWAIHAHKATPDGQPG